MSSHTDHTSPKTTSVVKDPVCGMDVYPGTSEHGSVHDGQRYHFCSRRCQAKFEANPETYVTPHGDAQHDDQQGHDRDHQHAGQTSGRTTVTGEVAEWTCPMHPEIRQPGP
jgi:YHS domain-containing protein